MYWYILFSVNLGIIFLLGILKYLVRPKFEIADYLILIAAIFNTLISIGDVGGNHHQQIILPRVSQIFYIISTTSSRCGLILLFHHLIHRTSNGIEKPIIYFGVVIVLYAIFAIAVLAVEAAGYPVIGATPFQETDALCHLAIIVLVFILIVAFSLGPIKNTPPAIRMTVVALFLISLAMCIPTAIFRVWGVFCQREFDLTLALSLDALFNLLSHSPHEIRKLWTEWPRIYSKRLGPLFEKTREIWRQFSCWTERTVVRQQGVGGIHKESQQSDSNLVGNESVMPSYDKVFELDDVQVNVERVERV